MSDEILSTVTIMDGVDGLIGLDCVPTASMVKLLSPEDQYI